MSGKASTYWPHGAEPKEGDVALGTEIGRKSKGIFRWSSCPDCGMMRWVAREQTTKLCMSCAATRRNLVGEKNPRWNNGIRQGKDGYKYITVTENHPFFEMAGRSFAHGKYRYYIAEHRLVMAQYLNRPLKPWELVHHKGTLFPSTDIRNKSDNRIENLELMSHKADHLPSMSVERIVHTLQKRVAVLEAEVTRLQSLLDSGRDGVPKQVQSMRRHNTLGDLPDKQIEGIVHPLSNEEEEQNRCCCFRRKELLRPSPEMALQNPAKSANPKSERYGNAELADSISNRASVETLHGASFGMKTKSDSHRKVSQIGLIPLSPTSSQVPIRVALTQWRYENPPKRGTLNSDEEHGNPVPRREYNSVVPPDVRRDYTEGTLADG